MRSVVRSADKPLLLCEHPGMARSRRIKTSRSRKLSPPRVPLSGVLAGAMCALLILVGGCGSTEDERHGKTGRRSSNLADTPKEAALGFDQSLREEPLQEVHISRFVCRSGERSVAVIDMPNNVNPPTAAVRREGAMWLVEVTYSRGSQSSSVTYEVRRRKDGYCVLGGR